MIGDKQKELIAYARRLNYPTRMFISLTGSCLKEGAGPDTDSDIVTTNGQYHLVYNTRNRLNELNKRKFCIVYDFGKGYFKFYSWDDLEEQANSNEHVRFFLKYTNLQPHMLSIARQNEGMHFPIALDIMKYDTEIRKREGWGPKDYHMIYNPFKETKTTWYEVKDGKIEKYDINRDEDGDE